MKASRNPKPAIDERLTCFRLVVRRSRIHRFGVFAVQLIPAGRKVIEYTGERISMQEAQRRLRRPERQETVLAAGLNRRWVLDAIRGGSGAEFINHSCEPNLRVRKTARRILFFSKRRIRRGEELTVDYRLGREARRFPCRCGAPGCRGTLNRA